jgi:hypothetical protein
MVERTPKLSPESELTLKGCIESQCLKMDELTEVLGQLTNAVKLLAEKVVLLEDTVRKK